MLSFIEIQHITLEKIGAQKIQVADTDTAADPETSQTHITAAHFVGAN